MEARPSQPVLDHSSLAVTSVYLRQLEGDRDTTWQRVAQVIDV
jgi:hypothetical protein